MTRKHNVPTSLNCEIRLLITSAWLLLAAGCEKKKVEAEVGSRPAAADTKTLVVGLIPEQNIFRQTERYQPIADYLSSNTGVKVQLTVRDGVTLIRKR